MNTATPKKAAHPDLKLQKVKNKRYYVKVPGLKIPVILNEYLFRKWKTANLIH